MSFIFKQITDEIIRAIEAGAEDFQMPWHRADGSFLPTNALTGKSYRGTNVLALWAAGANAGFASNRWATYRQWGELGAQVRKGERGTTVVFWKTRNSTAEADENGGEDRERRFIARAARVFNVAQVDGYNEPVALEPVGEIERIAAADAFFASLPIRVWHGSDEAFFDRRTDMISMPAADLFRSAAAYYSTLAHETIHWTGVKSRLDRDMRGRFGSAAYAMEELVAELGAAFLCSTLGIATIPRSDHAPYIASWLTVLQHDPRAIVNAASQSQAAVDFLLSLAPMTEAASAALMPEAA
jgi:antirestriction protein ArdC